MTTKRRKYTKKWLKEPDEFLTTMDLFLDWSSQHWRLVTGVVLGLIAVGVLGAGLIYYQRSVEKEFEAKLSQADSLYRQATVAQKGNYAPAIRQYRSLIEEFPNYRGIEGAYLHLGHLYLKTGALPQAVQIYTQALAHSRKDQLIREVALLGLGSAQEAMGKVKEASSTYQQILSMEEASLTAQAHLALGRCYEQLKNPKQALSHYASYLKQVQRDELIQEKVELLKARS